MKRLDDRDRQAVTQIARHNPAFVEFIKSWLDQEMAALPYAVGPTASVSQGRCQVLTELYKLVYDLQK